jgi:hypothetical protein
MVARTKMPVAATLRPSISHTRTLLLSLDFNRVPLYHFRLGLEEPCLGRSLESTSLP